MEAEAELILALVFGVVLADRKIAQFGTSRRLQIVFVKQRPNLCGAHFTGNFFGLGLHRATRINLQPAGQLQAVVIFQYPAHAAFA